MYSDDEMKRHREQNSSLGHALAPAVGSAEAYIQSVRRNDNILLCAVGPGLVTTAEIR